MAMDREPERELLRQMSPRTGAIVDYVIAWRAREEARRRQVVDDVLSRTGLTEEDLIERLFEHPRMAALLAQALQAATSATEDVQIQALGAAVSSGFLADDDARVDEAAIVTAAIARIGTVHIRGLFALVNEPPPEREGDERNPSLIIRDTLRVSDAAAGGLLSTLIREGLVVTDPPGFSGWQITPFGRACLAFLHDDSSAS